MSTLTFPTLVTRQGKGSPLSNAEMDANFTGLQQYCLSLANGLLSALTVGIDTGSLNACAITSGMPVSAYANGQVFFFTSNNTNTGACTLNVNGLGPVPIYASGEALPAGAITAGNVYAVAYLSGQFVLVAGSGSAGGSAGASFTFTFNGTTVFNSGQTAIPGVATDASGAVIGGASAAIAHGLGALPTSARLLLVKTASDATDPVVGIGQHVAAEQFFIVDAVSNDVAAPAFVVAYDASHVYVQQGAALPALGGGVQAAGSLVNFLPITPSSWAMVVTATLQTNVSNVAFPSLTYQVAQPEGAFSYGMNLFVWQYGASRKAINGLVIGLQSNQAAALSAPATGSPLYQNHAVFTRASGSVQSIFTSSAGIYEIPVVSPLVNIVPAAVLYSSAGYYTLQVAANTSYVISGGQNDLSYAFGSSSTGAASASYTAISPGVVASGANTCLYLKGSPSSAVTAAVSVSGGSWAPVQLFVPGAFPSGYTSQLIYNYKPVWITETSAGTLSAVYVAPASLSAGVGITSVQLWEVPASGTLVAQNPSGVTAGVDFTSALIASNPGSIFSAQHPSGSTAKITFFQYNPFNQRIYLMTSESNLLHIFVNLLGATTNGIVDLWTNSNRLGLLSYQKSLAIGGSGAWSANMATSGAAGNPNVFIEINQQTGLEQAIVLTLSGNVVRVPWLE